MTSQKTAAIIIIGDEILSGRTQDKNTQMMAKGLMIKGIALKFVCVIPDHHETIVQKVNDLRARYDYVLTSGGIGPTHDDITAESMAMAFHLDYVRHDGAYDSLIGYYGSEDQMNDGRRRMAMMPKGAGLIPNPLTGAPGFFVENVYVMAGVPVICEAMFAWVLNQLEGGQTIYQLSLKTNCVESIIGPELGQIQTKFPDLSIGSYPHFGQGDFFVTLVMRGQDTELLVKAAADVRELVKNKGFVVKAEDHQPSFG